MIVGVTLAPAVDRTARVERLGFDTILRPTAMRVLPGGKGINACRAAHLLGAQVATTGIAGGHAGRWLVESLQREGLNPHFVIVEAETRTTYVTTDDAGRSVLVYEPSLAIPADALEKLLELLRTDPLSSAEWVICSGSLPAGIGDDAYVRLVRAAHDAGQRCLIDVGGPVLERTLAEQPDVVKVSASEARAAIGAPAHARAADMARALARRGARLAVVTDGPRGASASDGRRSWTIRVPRVRAVNPIGAGDVFNAGLVVALGAGAMNEMALARAAAAASASVLELGAGEVDPVRVAEMLRLVVVREVGHAAI